MNVITKNLEAHIKALEHTINVYEQDLISIAEKCINTIEAGGKIIIIGNGGSAADAQHIAAELVGSFNNKTRPALPAIALTADTSALTSISNDYGYNCVFQRQLEALLQPKDVVIGISTSGNSKNILKALAYAKTQHSFVVGLSGNEGGEMHVYCDKNIIVASNTTSIIQEVHIFIAHSVCEIIDNYFIKKSVS